MLSFSTLHKLHHKNTSSMACFFRATF